MFHHEEAAAATEPKEGKPKERSRPKSSFDAMANASSSVSKAPKGTRESRMKKEHKAVVATAVESTELSTAENDDELAGDSNGEEKKFGSEDDEKELGSDDDEYEEFVSAEDKEEFRSILQLLFRDKVLKLRQSQRKAEDKANELERIVTRRQADWDTEVRKNSTVPTNSTATNTFAATTNSSSSTALAPTTVPDSARPLTPTIVLAPLIDSTSTINSAPAGPAQDTTSAINIVDDEQYGTHHPPL